MRLPSFLALCGLLVASILLIFSGAPPPLHAQTSPNQPNPDPACNAHYVLSPTGANVRLCASQTCGIVTTLRQNTVVCTKGPADNAAWLQVDLNPADGSSPIYFMAQSTLALGQPDSQPLFARCQPMLITGESGAALRECADGSCRVIANLEEYSWVCAREYIDGSLEGWAYAEQSDSGLVGWLSRGNLRPADNYNSGAAFYTPPAPIDPNSITSRTVTTALASGQPSSSTAPISIEGPMPSCQLYHVTAVEGRVRECASTTCATIQTMRLGEPLCVRGLTEALDWLIVDLQPQETESPLYVIHRTAVEAGDELSTISVTDCYDWQTVNTASQAVLRQCPSTTCAGVGLLEHGEMVCARAYGGEFSEWIQLDVSGGLSGAWMHGSLLRSVPLDQLPEGTDLTGVEVALQGQPSNPNTPPQQIDIAPVQPPIQPLIPPPPVEILNQSQMNIVEPTLLSLRVSDLDLSYPNYTARFNFSTPRNWAFTGENTLTLNLEYFDIIPISASGSQPPALNSRLEIRLNNRLVGAVLFDNAAAANQEISVPIPGSLLDNRRGNRHTIELKLLPLEHCQHNAYANVFIRNDISRFHFEYQESTPLLDLSQYPGPLFTNRLGTEPETILFVLPNSPSASDIQAGGRVATSLGNLSGGNVQILFRTPDSLTPAERQSNNMIYIGPPNRHELIEDLYDEGYLNTNRNTSGALLFNGNVINTEGVIEIIANPENPLRAILVVTGPDAERVDQAVRALVRLPQATAGSLALISDQQAPAIPLGSFSVSQSFDQLGFENLIISGSGEQSAYIDFNIPSNVRVVDNPYVELLYSFSDFINPQEATLTVWLNETVPISAIRLSDALTSPEAMVNNQHRLRINIPAERLISGQSNSLRLTLNTTRNVQDTCNPLGDELIWMVVSPDSQLNLPQEVSSYANAQPRLGRFPSLFNANLNDLWLFLPDVPSITDIEQAYQLLAELGSQTSSSGNFAPRLLLGDVPDGTDLSLYNYIIIGRPSNHSLLRALNEYLPQAFEENSDQLQDSPYLAYFPTDRNEIGLLQILPSIWSEQHIMLVISGTNAASEARALALLVDPNTDLNALSGNLVLVGQQSVISVNTLTGTP